MSSTKKNKKSQNRKRRNGTRITCIILVCLTLVGVISVGLISYNPDNSSDISPVETWSYGDLDDVFEEEYKKFTALTIDVNNLASFQNLTEEDIKTVETTCQHISDDAQAIQTALLQKAPPIEYEDAWNGFAACMGQISDLFAGYDPEYSNDEIEAWLRIAAYEFESISNEASDFTNDMMEINATITVVTDDFFLNIYNSEYQTITEYKVTLTGKISDAGNEIISVSFEHISGDECDPDYEIVGNVVSVSITHPTEGRLQRILTLNEDGTFSVSY